MLARFGPDAAARCGPLSINDVVMAAVCTYNNEGPAHVVGRQARDTGLSGALIEHFVDRVGAQACVSAGDAAGLVDGHEQRARLSAAPL